MGFWLSSCVCISYLQTRMCRANQDAIYRYLHPSISQGPLGYQAHRCVFLILFFTDPQPLTFSNQINAPIPSVIFLFILETLFVAFQITGHMRIFGVGWGDVAMFDTLDWSLVASPFLNGLSEWWMSAASDWIFGAHGVAAPLVTLTFYVWRIWGFTRNIWITMFLELVRCFLFTRIPLVLN